MTISGFHHVTAIAGDAQQNLDFYTQSLGLHLVKRTVNYDDPGTHHLYYGDAPGSPGSLLTFFPWGAQRKGTGGIDVAQAVSLQGRESSRPFRIASVTILESNLEAAQRLLAETLLLEQITPTSFRVADDQHIKIQHDPAAPPVKMGAGLLHHVALRAGTEESLRAWRERLVAAGLRVSAIRDRYYFHSVYFKHPGGTLFELATDAPGFTVDEPEDALGTKLCLPPWLEPHRAEIEARLTPIQFPT